MEKSQILEGYHDFFHEWVNSLKSSSNSFQCIAIWSLCALLLLLASEQYPAARLCIVPLACSLTLTSVLAYLHKQTEYTQVFLILAADEAVMHPFPVVSDPKQFFL